MAGYRIRRATERDLADLRFMNRALFGRGEPVPSFGTAECLSWIVTAPSGQPIGYATLEYRGGWTGYLSRAGVLPSHRGHGLQRRFIRAREREARRMGWEAMVTDTRVGSEASMRSLIRCGYKPFLPKDPWAMSDSVYWRKRL